MATESLKKRVHELLKMAARENETTLFRALLPFDDKEEWSYDDNSLLADIVLGGNAMLIGTWGEYFTQEQISSAIILALNLKSDSQSAVFNKRKDIVAIKLYQILRNKESLVKYFEKRFKEHPDEFSNESVVEIVRFLQDKKLQVPLRDIKVTCIEHPVFLDALQNLVQIEKSEEPINVFWVLSHVKSYYTKAQHVEKLLQILADENVDWNAEHVKTPNVCNIVGLREGMTVLDYAKNMENWEHKDLAVRLLEKRVKIQ